MAWPCSAARDASLCVAQPWTAASGMSQIAMARRNAWSDRSGGEVRAPFRPFGDGTTQSLGLTGVGLRVRRCFKGKRHALRGPRRRHDQIRASFAWARALSRRERCPRADYDDSRGAAAIFAAESDSLRRRQPERPRLQRRFSVLQQRLQRADNWQFESGFRDSRLSDQTEYRDDVSVYKKASDWDVSIGGTRSPIQIFASPCL
jgi:hypothetical protein